MMPKKSILGDLTEIACYVYYDGPQLYSCKNEREEIFFAIAEPSSSLEEEIYLYSRINEDILESLKEGTSQVFRYAILNGSEHYLVRFQRSGQQVVEKYEDTLTEEWLPSKN